MKDILNRVYNNFIELFENYKTHIEVVTDFITYIDIIYSKANIAKKYNYCKPKIDINAQKSYVDAKGLRHSLIENLQQHELYVTNDICLGN